MTETGEAPTHPAGLGSTARVWLGGIVVAGLLLIGFRGLIGYEPAADLRPALEGAERFFFSPVDGSPRLILALAALLLYQRRHAMLRLAARPLAADLALGLFVLAAGGVLAVWSTYVGLPELLVPALSATLLGMATLIGGKSGLRAMLVPALFLLLAWRPPGILVNQLIHPMQIFTAHTTAEVLAFFGMQAFSSGDLVFANEHAFHVIETCAGVRSVFTLVMAAVVYVEMMGCPRLRAVVVVALAPIIGLLTNELRVIAMVLNPLSRFATVHTLQGVVMIVLGVLMLAGIERLLAWTLLPGVRGFRTGPLWPVDLPPAARIRAAVMLAALLVVALSTMLVPVWPDPGESGTPLHVLPHRLDGWQSTPLRPDDELLGSARASEWLYRAYAKDGREVVLRMAVDSRLDPRISMLSDKQLLPGPGWRIVERHGVALPGGRFGQEILLASPEGETQLSWWWSRHVEPPCVEILRALLGLDRGLARRPESARLLAVRTDVDPEHPEPARAALKILLALALDDLEKRGEDVW